MRGMMMQKKSVGIIILAIFGFVVGIFNLWKGIGYIGFHFVSAVEFLSLAIVCAVLSLGLLKLRKWARIATFIFSSLTIPLCLLLIYGTWLHFEGYRQTWAFWPLIELFPSLLFSLCAIFYLTRPKVKNYFYGDFRGDN